MQNFGRDSKIANSRFSGYRIIGDIANIVTSMYASTEENKEVDGWVEVVIEYHYTKTENGKEVRYQSYLYEPDMSPIKVKLEGRVEWNFKDET